jgi:uncharacterized protein (DUF2141 family)
MKGLLRLLAGGAMIATAHAQSGATHVDFLPMPKTLPTVFFAPDSLAGPMLKPLQEPEAAPDTAEAAAAEQAPAGSDTLAQVQPEQMPIEPVSPSQPSESETTTGALAEPEPEEPAAAPATPSGTIIHVIVENVESNKGTVNVAVCDTGLSQDGCPYTTSTPATQGFVEVVFDDVPPGEYAVVGYHDVNNNDQFDKFLSMPREPYALSGEAANSLIPAFRDAQLKINQGENYVIIRMKRLGSG